MGLILDTSLLIADERAKFNLSSWLRSRPPEPVAATAVHRGWAVATFNAIEFRRIPGLEVVEP